MPRLSARRFCLFVYTITFVVLICLLWPQHQPSQSISADAERFQATWPPIIQQAPVLQEEPPSEFGAKRKKSLGNEDEEPIREPWFNPFGVLFMPMNVPPMEVTNRKNLSVKGENEPISKPKVMSEERNERKKKIRISRKNRIFISSKKHNKPIGKSLKLPPIGLEANMNLPIIRDDEPWLMPEDEEAVRLMKPPAIKENKRMKKIQTHRGRTNSSNEKHENLFGKGKSWLKTREKVMAPSLLHHVKRNKTKKKIRKADYIREMINLLDKEQNRLASKSRLSPRQNIWNMMAEDLFHIKVAHRKNISVNGKKRLIIADPRIFPMKTPLANRNGRKKKRRKEEGLERVNLSAEETEKQTDKPMANDERTKKKRIDGKGDGEKTYSLKKEEERPTRKPWLLNRRTMNKKLLSTEVTDEKNSTVRENNLIDEPLIMSGGTILMLRKKKSPLKRRNGREKKRRKARRERKSLPVEEKEKPIGKRWFMSGGSVMPTSAPPGVDNGLWPAQQPFGDDRIINQLMFRPPVDSKEPWAEDWKTILDYNRPMKKWSITETGHSAFSSCPVYSCKLTEFKSDSWRADAILFKDYFIHPGHGKPNNQVWILYLSESPYHTHHVKYTDVINWTASYRRDSDLVTPYGKFVYYDPSVRQLSKPLKNYVANKTKQVAWFVSNCNTSNNRLQYARELQKYISVDIYGDCGFMECPKSDRERCQVLTNEYKFYLSFENSNCKDYITEKLFVNALQNDVLPIVMGARPEDYKSSAPEHSFIHVDDFDSPRALAEYLLLLDKDDEIYNSYFKWKGTGEFINTYFWCRLCAMLHDTRMPTKWYKDVDQWWSGPETCTASSWSNNRTKSPQRPQGLF